MCSWILGRAQVRRNQRWRHGGAEDASAVFNSIKYDLKTADLFCLTIEVTNKNKINVDISGYLMINNTRKVTATKFYELFSELEATQRFMTFSYCSFIAEFGKATLGSFWLVRSVQWLVGFNHCTYTNERYVTGEWHFTCYISSHLLAEQMTRTKHEASLASSEQLIKLNARRRDHSV